LTPLRLTWTLATPIVVGAYPLHLDALIAFAMAAEGRQQDLASWDDSAKLQLPLELQKQGELECWKASVLTPTQPSEHSMRFWTRKSDAYDYAQRLEAGQLDVKTKFPLKPYGTKFDTVRGTFKQMFKFFPVRSVQQLQAWCVGDEDRIAELLSPESGFITYLGQKSRMGFGRITGFEIAQDQDALEKWKGRVLPWPEKDCVEVEAATQMPYWEVTNRTRAWINPALYD
jgi:CRISPR type IV-associated protein Csf3